MSCKFFLFCFLKLFLKSSTGKRKEQLRWWSPLFCYSPFAGHLSTPSTCCLSIVSIAGACRKFNVKQELFFWYSFSAHCHLFKVSLLFSSLSCDLFLFFQMIWRRNMMESQLTWSLPLFRPSGSLTALTIPLCTPSWTRTSRRAASLPSPTASKKLTSGVLLWRRPNWVCSSSNLRLEKPSSSQMQATVHSSTQHWKALQVPRVVRARWK